MNEFKPHDYFNADDQGYISRKVFIEHVRKTYDQIHELTAQLQQTEQELNAQLQQTEQELNAQLTQEEQHRKKQIKSVNNQLYGGIMNRRPLIVIESDDALIQDYDVLRPFLAVRNVPCTIAIPTALIDRNAPTMMTWAQIHDLVDNYGWDVASHTHNNVRTAKTVTDEEVEAEFRLSKEKLEQEGLNSDHFTYVGGVFDDRTIKIARKYFKSSATVNRNPGNHILPLRSHHLSRSSLMSLSLEHLKADVDSAVHHDGLLIIYTHGNDFADDPTLQTKLSDVIAYAQGLGAEFVTRSEAIKVLGNIVETSTDDNQTSALQITQTGQIFQDKQEISGHPPEMFSFTRDAQAKGTYRLQSLKTFPKHIAVTIDGVGATANSTGFAAYNPDGTDKQFCKFTRSNGRTISNTTHVGIMAVDNANQTRVSALLDRYIKQVALTFTILGTGYSGNMVVNVMVYY